MNIDFIKQWEGKVLKEGEHICYDDLAPPKRDATGEILEEPKYVGGVPTVGYGTTEGLDKDDIGVLTITEEEAEKYLMDHVQPLVDFVTRQYGLTGDKLTAIVSFIYNLGKGALYGRSTKIGYWLGQGNWAMAAKGMKRYNKARVNGELKVLPGLVNRREAEVCLLVGKT